MEAGFADEDAAELRGVERYRQQGEIQGKHGAVHGREDPGTEAPSRLHWPLVQVGRAAPLHDPRNDVGVLDDDRTGIDEHAGQHRVRRRTPSEARAQQVRRHSVRHAKHPSEKGPLHLLDVKETTGDERSRGIDA